MKYRADAYDYKSTLSSKECPKIIAWAKRCLQKETVANSLADQKKVYEAVGQLRKMRGLE
ncbi:putative glutathione s-transferase parc [Quercus suber]|uniref:Glutathione s-transferase parc n=1 Tax=Quercus suber TaxID=58331 RepID=A0AAW0K2P3_QUESU